jgi:hypothetical protein
MESQFNAPPGQRDDRSWVFQNDHGPGLGNTISNPGNLDKWGRWRPYGAIPGGDMSARWAAYSVCWRTDRVTKFVDNREAVTRAFTWTGPAEPNIIVYNSVGSDRSHWPGPVRPDTFTGDNAKFRIKAIRIFKPSVLHSRLSCRGSVDQNQTPRTSLPAMRLRRALCTLF